MDEFLADVARRPPLMESALLDTDVFSYFFKQDTRASLYEPDIRGRQVCLCFQTVAEVKAWAIGRQWGPSRRNALDRALAHYAVLPFDARMADAWASVTASRKLIGQPIQCGDAWIVAAALRDDLPLLTHNARHYRDIPGLRLVTHSGPPKQRRLRRGAAWLFDVTAT